MRSSALFPLGLLLLALAAPAAGQEREGAPAPADTLGAEEVARMDLPPEVAEEVVEFFNDPGTLHLSGRTRIPAERVVSGDVAVLGGPLVVAGRIAGRVVVINGDVELLPGAVVEGGLTVVGGEVAGAEGARVGGEVVAYSERLRYRRRGERIVHADPPGERERAERRDGELFGRSSFLVATGQSYNRVEGLPVVFGPVVETAGSNPFRVRALAIYRTEAGPFLETDRWGYRAGAEQFFGGHRSFRLGAGVHSVVDPIEEWHVSDTENGLSTFLFHRDYRDHYERTGWSTWATLSPRGAPFSLTAEYRSEEHSIVPVGDPWSIFDNGDAWRRQPLVGVGELRTLLVRGEVDTRNDRHDPSTGWYVSGRVEQALDSELVRPAAFRPVFHPNDDVSYLPVDAVAYGDLTAGLLDVRRYNRIGPDSRLNLRLLLGGSLDGEALPPQRQHVLGGEGSLPGYGLFELACGARTPPVALDPSAGGTPFGGPELFVPAYGCDRFALVQAEYRGELSFRFDWSDHPWHDGDDEEDDDDDDHGDYWRADLDWVTFVDAARGWSLRGDGEAQTGVDAGVGLLFDRLGVYAAVPLRGGKGINLFVRLGSRF